MASDETKICNLALGKIGSVRIMSLADASQTARYCTLFYAQTRDEILRSHSWNFATKRAALSALSAAPLFGWDAQYQLPTDCLRVLQLNGFEATEQSDQFAIEQGVLLTDETTAQIIYTARIEDANLYDPLFIKALSIRLAAELAQPLTGSRSAGPELLKEYDALFEGPAMRKDAAESKVKRKLPWVNSDLVNARFFSDIG